MKVKEMKHIPVFFNKYVGIQGDACWSFNCALGNGKIVKVGDIYFVNIFGEDKYTLSAQTRHKTISNAKLYVQRLCNEYLQQALGWLETSVKYKLGDE